MRGVVYLGASEVEVRDFDRPEPGPGQVVIEMRVAGLCGSDLHKYHSSREWAKERKGMISGHEPAAVAGLHGTVIYVGAGAASLEIDFMDILRKELTLRGNSVYSMGAYFDAVAFLQTHPVPLDEIVTHRFSIEQAKEAFEIFDSGETGKVIFEWEGGEGL